MKKFNRFYFESFEFDKKTLKAKFNYSFDQMEYFTEEIDFFCENKTIRNDFDIEVINNILFHCHIAI